MKISNLTILAIESSCDDTGVAVLQGNKVLSNLVANQEIHARYGGVVPELASRAHLSNITPTVELAISDAGISKIAFALFCLKNLFKIDIPRLIIWRCSIRDIRANNVISPLS